jgi:hypothetical protein
MPPINGPFGDAGITGYHSGTLVIGTNAMLQQNNAQNPAVFTVEVTSPATGAYQTFTILALVPTTGSNLITYNACQIPDYATNPVCTIKADGPPQEPI